MEDAFVSRCERVMRENAQSPLSDGRRATLRRHESEFGPWFELMPSHKRACCITVTPNGPGDGELSVGVGRNDSSFEVWGSTEETLGFLRRALDAVIAGGYEEFVKGRKAIGRLELSDAPFLFRDNTMFVRWPPRLGAGRAKRTSLFDVDLVSAWVRGLRLGQCAGMHPANRRGG